MSTTPLLFTSEKIKVCIRIRPFLSNEKKLSSISPIIIDETDDQKLRMGKDATYYESYFDKIFFPSSTQKDIYDYVSYLTRDVVNGVNCTILAYGQTGSGKTYTMFGKEWTVNENNSNNIMLNDEYNFLYNDISIDPFDEGNGVIPRVVYSLFNNELNLSEYNIYCSFVQIYNEKIYDLLDCNKYDVNNKNVFRIRGKNDFSTQKPIEQQPLVIRENKSVGLYIENLIQKEIQNFYDCISILRVGEANRKKRQTSKNDLSSRSHTLLMIMIESKEPDNNGYMISSQINLCDLAGSEKYDKSYKYNKFHLNELVNINKSLSALGNVINALTNKRSYIPFKDSKLTMLLQNSLGGNTRTVLIANVSPIISAYDETLSTLKFADRAHSLMTKIEPSKILSTHQSENSSNNTSGLIIDKLTKEVNELKQLLNIRQRNGLVGVNSISNGEEIEKELIFLRKENEKLKKKLEQANIYTPKSGSMYGINKKNNILRNTGNSIVKHLSHNQSKDTSVDLNNNFNSYANSNYNINKSIDNEMNFNTLKLLEKMQMENNRRMKMEIEAIKQKSQTKRAKIVYV